MNDDSLSTSAAHQQRHGEEDSRAQDTPATRSEDSPAVKRAKVQTEKKLEFIKEMMFNLDLLIYAHISVLYYMDCSFFRFIIRVVCQLMFLTPKPPYITQDPQHRPFGPGLLGVNGLCILLHILTHRPEAGELTRGYLHGGIIIDFIGQKGPTSKIHLILLDLLVLGLQCFMTAVYAEQVELEAILKLPSLMLGAAQSIVVPGQDYDAEEQGVFRTAVTASDDIEMQDFSEANTERGSEQPRSDEERVALLSPLPGEGVPLADDGPLDLFYSGNVILSDFHVLHALRQQKDKYGQATAGALQTIGGSAGYHFTRINHRLQRLDRLR